MVKLIYNTLFGPISVLMLEIEIYTMIGIFVKDEIHHSFLYSADVGNSKVDEPQLQIFPDDSGTESTASTGIGKNFVNEDELKSTYAVDSPVC